MRDGVMDVQQVKFVIRCNLRHTSGECQVVGWIFEQRIIRDRHLMKCDVLFTAAKTERLRIRDEMDLVSGGGQFDAEFGSDDAAASVGGIAGDSNLHSLPYRGYRLKMPKLTERRAIRRFGAQSLRERLSSRPPWVVGEPSQSVPRSQTRQR